MRWIQFERNLMLYSNSQRLYVFVFVFVWRYVQWAWAAKFADSAWMKKCDWQWMCTWQPQLSCQSTNTFAYLLSSCLFIQLQKTTVKAQCCLRLHETRPWWDFVNSGNIYIGKLEREMRKVRIQKRGDGGWWRGDKGNKNDEGLQ